jgi:hypothetical protein
MHPVVVSEQVFCAGALQAAAFYADENVLIFNMEICEALRLLAAHQMMVNCIVTQNFFIRHPSAFSGPAAYTFPSVGAFDLCPGRDETQLPVLKAFLVNVLETVSAGIPYQEEQGLF